MMARIQLIAIKPKIGKLIDPVRLGREFDEALRHTGNIVRDDFGKTVRTWSDKPSFEQRGPVNRGADRTHTVSTDHEVYTYVTRGTRAHAIRPRTPGGLLRFRTGYRAKTRPKIIGSRGGGATGPFVTARSVQHPGTEARDFDKEIAKRRQKNLTNLTRLAIRRAIRTR